MKSKDKSRMNVKYSSLDVPLEIQCSSYSRTFFLQFPTEYETRATSVCFCVSQFVILLISRQPNRSTHTLCGDAQLRIHRKSVSTLFSLVLFFVRRSFILWSFTFTSFSAPLLITIKLRRDEFRCF